MKPMGYAWIFTPYIWDETWLRDGLFCHGSDSRDAQPSGAHVPTYDVYNPRDTLVTKWVVDNCWVDLGKIWARSPSFAG